jgi:hypothetical protein
MTNDVAGAVEQWRANRTQSAMRAVGGKLVLTETQLEFRPNRVDTATGGRAWSAELAQIRSGGTEKRGRNPLNGSIRERLRVETADGGAELVVVNGLEQVIERIRRALPAADPA